MRSADTAMRKLFALPVNGTYLDLYDLWMCRIGIDE